MNLVNCFIDFKKEVIKNYSNILYENIEKDNGLEILDSYVTNYIEAYYFHILQTLDKEEVKKYDYKTIVKEFDGKRLELIYENKSTKEFIDSLYVIVLVAIKLDHLTEITEDNLEKTLSQLNFKVSRDIFTKLYLELKENNKKMIKFFKSLDYDSLSLEYKKYRDRDGKYHVSLKQDIKVLNNRYLETSIEKNFNKEEIAINKFITTLYLLSIDLLYKIKDSQELDIYFIDLPSILLDDDNIEFILSKIYNENISQNISFLVNYNDYLNHKRVLNSLDKKYSFSAYVDMSHINFIENKIEAIESIDLFDFGILDKVKSKDYETIIKYELKGKEIFNSEFEKE